MPTLTLNPHHGGTTPPSLLPHFRKAVPPNALHFVPRLAHASLHVVDATGCLPSIHSCFLLPESLMVSRAAESTSPDGCCSGTFCYKHHHISSLTYWGLVLLVAKSVLTGASPSQRVQCPLHKPLRVPALQQQLPHPHLPTAPISLPQQRAGTEPTQ